MAIIVMHKRPGEKSVLLGAGFGAYRSKKAHWLLGDLGAETDKGHTALVCVCTGRGEIGWIRSDQLLVDTVVGHPVSALVPEIEAAGPVAHQHLEPAEPDGTDAMCMECREVAGKEDMLYDREHDVYFCKACVSLLES